MEIQTANQKKLKQEAAWRKLKEGPRHLITEADSLSAISTEQSHPIIKGIFVGKTQHSV